MQQRTPDTLLGQTAVPAMELKAHGEGYQTPADFAIRNVGRVKVRFLGWLLVVVCGWGVGHGKVGVGVGLWGGDGLGGWVGVFEGCHGC